ncbi:MAG: YkgJ family cysteine cluster protein, partial [Tyzzerella sp.]|nr:YkgJ family cysteine cluster protein [Tyzzerella sp.]
AELVLYADGQRTYESNRRAFHKMMGLQGSGYEAWANYLEQLMVYFVFTYFCGAVYDGNILGKMQTAVVSTLLIQELAIAKWCEQGNTLDFHDFVDIAHRVSREIEHSDVNLIRMEKICEKMPMFSTEELLRVVLSVILLEG